MKYDTSYLPTTEQADETTVYIATFEDDVPNDGEAGTYDEAEYDSYEREVIMGLDGEWTTETDENGVYLKRQE